jgi:hypothetical protein
MYGIVRNMIAPLGLQKLMFDLGYKYIRPAGAIGLADQKKLR